MKRIITLIALCVGFTALAQQRAKSPDAVVQSGSSQKVKDSTQQKAPDAAALQMLPEFPGGQPAIEQYIKANLKYPEQAKKDNIQGRVGVRFVINKDGSVGEAKVMKGIGGGCDEEALRLIKNMPKWNPGINNMGLPVKTVYALPITFSLK
ncbi:MAG: energy transducer TonB [Sphingobacteriales bacterium]|nr:MAG: energy transducer TonB [Sphingobacteriales bacterium]